MFDTDAKLAIAAGGLLSPGMMIDGAYPPRAVARTDVEGRVRLTFQLGEAHGLVRVWADQEGQPPRLGLGSVSRVSGGIWPDVTITRMKSLDRRITIKGTDRRPIEGNAGLGGPGLPECDRARADRNPDRRRWPIRTAQSPNQSRLPVRSGRRLPISRPVARL